MSLIALLSFIACHPTSEKPIVNDPIDPMFDQFVVIGASLSQGIQSAVPSDLGANASPGSVLANMVNANFPQPLLKPGIFREISFDLMGEAPECSYPSKEGFLTQSALELFGRIINPETNDIDFRLALQDPTLEIQNLGVGGSRLRSVLHGLDPSIQAHQLMGRLVLDPAGEYGDDFSTTALERAEELNPTFIMSPDLFGNDIISAIVNSDTVDLNELTPLDELETDMELLLERLADTGAIVYISTLPRVSILPRSTDNIRTMRAEGYSEEEINDLLAAVDAHGFAANEMLEDYASQHPNIYITPLYDRVEDVIENGFVIGEHTLYPTKFDGLISLDGFHFSDTGYAMVAEAFIDQVNADFELDIPRPDLESIYASDRVNPDNLRAMGFDVDACE